MKVIVYAKRYNEAEDVREEVRARLDKKLAKLDVFFPDEAVANVCMTSEHGRERLELTISYKGVVYRAEVFEQDMFTAVDKATSIIERQIRKNRTRLEKRLREGAFTELPPLPEADEQEEYKITRVKEFPIVAMSPEDAVMEMNLSDHNFYLFRDLKTDEVLVAYRKANNEYGIIKPVRD